MKTTRNSLLLRLGDPSEQVAWEEFYKAYADAIIRYGLKLGLGEHQSQDVLQETMATLMRILPEFKYDPRRGKFRNFILTIVHQKALRAIRRRTRRAEISVDEPDETGRPLLDSLAEPETDVVGEADELRWRHCLLEQCLDRLREDTRIQPSTYDIFFAYAIEQKECQDVAKIYGVQENAVYQIKNRMLARLEEMMRALLDEETS